MSKFELTKSIEARKLNPRTRLPVGPPQTVPCGAIIEGLVRERGTAHFTYLGEPYEAPYERVEPALSKLT